MTEKFKTLQELAAWMAERRECGCYTHHSASRRGYVSRRLYAQAEPYHGRFGDGWIIASPRYDSTQYCNITYFVRPRKK